MDQDALTYKSNARPIHARRVWTEPALCGDIGPSQYAVKRAYVDCPGCLAEIERRLADRARRAAATQGPASTGVASARLRPRS